MNKQMKCLALYALPHILIMMFCLSMIILGVASPFINGFAVDAQERVYVGEANTICIFQNGAQVGKINLISDNYSFTINRSDELIVAYPSTVYRMDTTGNILETWEDPYSEKYQELRNSSKTVSTPNGNTYRKISEFGWTRIEKNETVVVYRLPAFSFAVKVLIYVCVISMFGNGAWIIPRLRRMS